MRQAFFAEVGAVLSALGAAPALRAPKKLNGDAGVCLRYAPCVCGSGSGGGGVCGCQLSLWLLESAAPAFFFFHPGCCR